MLSPVLYHFPCKGEGRKYLRLTTNLIYTMHQLTVYTDELLVLKVLHLTQVRFAVAPRVVYGSLKLVVGNILNNSCQG